MPNTESNNGYNNNANQNPISQKTIFAMNIYDYIQMSGLSQAEIAKRAGISKSALSAYVKGTNYPRPEQMQALARALNVSVGDLVGSGPEKIGKEYGGVTLPQVVRDMVEVMMLLTPEQRACLLDVAVTMEARNNR